MALTQADLDKLDKAIATGARRVTYASGTVEFHSLDEMLKARAHIAGLLASSVRTGTMTSLVVFDRGC